jgi:hypothetical protein
MMLGGGGSQQIMVLSKLPFFLINQLFLRSFLCLDSNTKRDQGKKAQFSNIFAAKVLLSFFFIF